MGNCFDCLKGGGREPQEPSYVYPPPSPILALPKHSPVLRKTATDEAIVGNPILGVHIGQTASSKSNHPSTQPKVVRRLFEESPSGSVDHEGSDARRGAVLDINYSNNHQLRVIGLNRIQADSIINYRVQYGHFMNKEELRNVPGIDYETWCRINPKITLVPNGSHNFIRPSLRHVVHQKSNELPEGIEVNRSSTVDINYSNYHELCVMGLSKLQAMALVDYRSKHGHFTCTDDIKEIITDEVYQKIQQRLTCTKQMTPRSTPLSSSKIRRSGGKRSLIPRPVHQLLNSSNGFLPTLGFDNSLGTRSNSEPDIFAYPPKVQPKFYTPPKDKKLRSDQFQHLHGYPSASPRLSGTKSGIVRIASWNLQCLTEKKIAYEGVMETICTVILKHGYIHLYIYISMCILLLLFIFSLQI